MSLEFDPKDQGVRVYGRFARLAYVPVVRNGRYQLVLLRLDRPLAMPPLREPRIVVVSDRRVTVRYLIAAAIPDAAAKGEIQRWFGDQQFVTRRMSSCSFS